MRIVLLVALLALIASLGWGFYAQSLPAPPRAHEIVTSVDDTWRAALPADPETATHAFLNRVPPEMRARGEAMSNSRYMVLGSRIALGIASLALFLFTGGAGSLGDAVGRIMKWRWAQDVLFGAAFFALLWVISLPVDVYAGYVRLRHFGFADRPFLDWLQDDFIEWATITAFYLVGIAAFMALIRRRPKTWVVWGTAVYLVLAGLYVVVTPTVIEPLTNNYTPLPDSELKRDILAMARANGVPASDVYTRDASRQSRLLNAHVSGIFNTARISIDDTTLTGAYAPAILAVVGHEIGHYVMGHIYQFVIVQVLIGALGFAFIAWLGPALIRRFSSWKIPDFGATAGIAVFWALFTIWGFVTDPAINAYSRWTESQADLYGLNASQAPLGIAEFMIQDADTARLSPTPLDVFLFYDHPSDISRVETAMRWRAAHITTQEPPAPADHVH